MPRRPTLDIPFDAIDDDSPTRRIRASIPPTLRLRPKNAREKQLPEPSAARYVIVMKGSDEEN